MGLEETMPLDGVSVVALLLLAAFVIERVVSAVLFVLPTVGICLEATQIEVVPSQTEAERQRHELWLKQRERRRQRTIAYLRFFLSGAFAAAIIWQYPTLQVLHLFGLKPANWLDWLVTGVVLLGGAERIAAFVKPPQAVPQGKAKEPPVEVTGTLTLEDGRVPK